MQEVAQVRWPGAPDAADDAGVRVVARDEDVAEGGRVGGRAEEA